MSEDKDDSVFERRAEEFQKFKRGDEVIFPTGSQLDPVQLDENFVVSEVNVDPVGDMMTDFLIKRDREDSLVDFKEVISISRDWAFAKIAKDIFGFANRGGGFILVGFRERDANAQEGIAINGQPTQFQKVGLPEDFHIDQADLQAKFNAYSNATIQLGYREFLREVDGEMKKFAIVYIPASTKILRPVKDGTYPNDAGTVKRAFTEGSIFIRRGTQCVPATKEEIAWMEKRASKEGYRVSLLSGQPDEIQEYLYSNMFRIISLPEVVSTAHPQILTGGNDTFNRNLPPDLVYRRWNDGVVTLGDATPFMSTTTTTLSPISMRTEVLTSWLADADRRRMIISLLNKELAFRARRLGMLQEPRRQKFYYGCDGEYRNEAWTTRQGRASSLKVAGRIWAQQLHQPIYWHLAVEAKFIQIGDEIVLRLNPSLQLSSDGRKAVFGQREGTVITRLIYRWYNATYLTQLLFWIWRFAEGMESFSLAQGRVVVAATPIRAGMAVGILHDRPTNEPLESVPEIALEEGA